MYQPPTAAGQTDRAAPERPARRLMSRQQFSDAHPAFTVPALNNIIFHSKPRKTSKGNILANGFGPAILHYRRKVMIDEAKFLEILDSLNGRPGPGDEG